MPNQLNFPEPISPPYVQIRPEHVSGPDNNLVRVSEQQILFGTATPSGPGGALVSKDLVELWVYNGAGEIAGHTTLTPTNPFIQILTAVDNTQAYEFLNLDFGGILQQLLIEPGRYTVVVNIFRDEVGSETGNKLYIKDISDDRTELRLQPSTITAGILTEMYEWVTPFVPKTEAQGLIDQLFGISLGALPTEVLTPDKVLEEADKLIKDTVLRLTNVNLIPQMHVFIQTLLTQIRIRTLNNMAMDVSNSNIQARDLESYLMTAIDITFQEYKQQHSIDARINLF